MKPRIRKFLAGLLSLGLLLQTASPLSALAADTGTARASAAALTVQVGTDTFQLAPSEDASGVTITTDGTAAFPGTASYANDTYTLTGAFSSDVTITGQSGTNVELMAPATGHLVDGSLTVTDINDFKITQSPNSTNSSHVVAKAINVTCNGKVDLDSHANLLSGFLNIDAYGSVNISGHVDANLGGTANEETITSRTGDITFTNAGSFTERTIITAENGNVSISSTNRDTITSTSDAKVHVLAKSLTVEVPDAADGKTTADISFVRAYTGDNSTYVVETGSAKGAADNTRTRLISYAYGTAYTPIAVKAKYLYIGPYTGTDALEQPKEVRLKVHTGGVSYTALIGPDDDGQTVTPVHETYGNYNGTVDVAYADDTHAYTLTFHFPNASASFSLEGYNGATPHVVLKGDGIKSSTTEITHFQNVVSNLTFLQNGGSSTVSISDVSAVMLQPASGCAAEGTLYTSDILYNVTVECSSADPALGALSFRNVQGSVFIKNESGPAIKKYMSGTASGSLDIQGNSALALTGGCDYSSPICAAALRLKNTGGGKVASDTVRFKKQDGSTYELYVSEKDGKLGTKLGSNAEFYSDYAELPSGSYLRIGPSSAYFSGESTPSTVDVPTLKVQIGSGGASQSFTLIGQSDGSVKASAQSSMMDLTNASYDAQTGTYKLPGGASGQLDSVSGPITITGVENDGLKPSVELGSTHALTVTGVNDVALTGTVDGKLTVGSADAPASGNVTITNGLVKGGTEIYCKGSVTGQTASNNGLLTGASSEYPNLIHCEGEVYLENTSGLVTGSLKIEGATNVTVKAGGSTSYSAISGSADITCSGKVEIIGADNSTAIAEDLNYTPLSADSSYTVSLDGTKSTHTGTYTASATKPSNDVLREVKRILITPAASGGNTDPGDDSGTDTPADAVSTSGGDAGAGGAVAAVMVGSAAVWGGYEVATRVILHKLLPEGAAIPANRAELALLVWNTAGKPEPASAPAFADVADADTAKAAQWCAEQGLLEAKTETAFAPDGRVTKVKVIRVWNTAFPKR